MKKKIIVLLMAIIATICGVFGYSHYNNKEIQTEPNSSIVDPRDIICYYGCPNSNRVKKLNITKKGRKI